jgi:hypothetical protein
MIVKDQVGKRLTQQNKGQEMITDREDYKLDITLRKHGNDQYVIKIKKYVPELGWREFFFMVTPEELDKIRTALEIAK